MPARKTTRTQAPGSWVKIHTGLPRHPKITSAGKPGALALALVAICLAADAKTDGEFDLDFAIREACTDEVTGKALIANDFFHEYGHKCKKCPQPRHKGLHIVHDFLEWQRPAATAASLSEKRREYGKRGGEARRDAIAARKAIAAAGRAPAPAAAPPAAPAPKRRRKAVEQPSLLDHDSGSTSYPATLTSSEAATEAKPVKTEAEMKLDADVKTVCDYLADKIQTRRGKRPKITESGWLTPARMLLTKDNDGQGFRVDQITYVIDWVTNESTPDGAFWASIINSIKALRAKNRDSDLPRFDQFRDKIMIQHRTRKFGNAPAAPSAGHRNMTIAERDRADEEFLASFGKYSGSPTPQEELWAA